MIDTINDHKLVAGEGRAVKSNTSVISLEHQELLINSEWNKANRKKEQIQAQARESCRLSEKLRLPLVYKVSELRTGEQLVLATFLSNTETFCMWLV